MRAFGFGSGFGFGGQTNNNRLVTGGSPPPAELFPDPGLDDVADPADGWQYSNGFPFFGPEGGTGPGIQAVACFDDDTASLVGADDTAFAAAIGGATNLNVAITFANVVTPTDITVTILEGSTGTFTPANGTVTQSVAKGAGGQSFFMACIVAGGTFDITHISVTAA